MIVWKAKEIVFLLLSNCNFFFYSYKHKLCSPLLAHVTYN